MLCSLGQHLAGKDALVDFGVYGRYVQRVVLQSRLLLQGDRHEDVEHRHKLRKTAADSAQSRPGGGRRACSLSSSMDKFFYELPGGREPLHELNYGLVTGSSRSLTSSALGSLPSSSSGGAALRSRFSVVGSEAGYTETVDGDDSDFELPFGVYRQ